MSAFPTGDAIETNDLVPSASSGITTV